MLFSSLPVRQWDRWLDAKMPHLFSLSLDARKPDGAFPGLEGTIEASSTPVDLLRGLATACPSAPFGGVEDFSVSRTHLAISARPELEPDEAWSTNRHISTFREMILNLES